MSPCLFVCLSLFSCDKNEQKEKEISTVQKINHPFEADTQYSKLAVGLDQVCALRITGEVDCIGGGEWGEGLSPEGKFTDIFAGVYKSCGIRETGEFVCWGAGVDKFGIGVFKEMFPLNPPFEQIELGRFMVCALDQNKMAQCFLKDQNVEGNIEVIDVPEAEGPFKQFDLKGYTACGVRENGTSFCWGGNGDSVTHGTHTNKPDEVWKFVSSSHYGWAIGVTELGQIQIWGRDVHRQKYPGERENPYVPTPLEGIYVDASINTRFHCGRDSSNIIHCKTNDSIAMNLSSLPEVPILSWELGGNFGCGLDEKGIVHCWGNFDPGIVPN